MVWELTFTNHPSCSENAPKKITAVMASRWFVKIFFNKCMTLVPTFWGCANPETNKFSKRYELKSVSL